MPDQPTSDLASEMARLQEMADQLREALALLKSRLDAIPPKDSNGPAEEPPLAPE